LREDPKSIPHRVIEDFARQYVRLGERDPDSLDHYAGPEEQVADIRRNPPKISQILQSATELADRLGALPGLEGDDRERSQFLLSQLHSIAARADLLSRVRLSQPRADFDQEALALFGVRMTTVANQQMNSVRGELGTLLKGKRLF